MKTMTEIVIGRDEYDDPVALQNINDSQHIMGNPGTGKSHYLAHMAEQHFNNGSGVLLIDIKDGELAQQVAGRTSRPEDVILTAPGLVPLGQTWSINLLEGNHTLVVDRTMEMFNRNDVFNETMTQVKQYLRMGLWLALQDDNPTLQTVLNILVKPNERRRILGIGRMRRTKRQVGDTRPNLDPEVEYFWHDFDSQSKRDDINSREQRGQVESAAVRLRELLTGDPLSALLSQPENGFHLGEWLDQGKMVICDLVSSHEGMPMSHSRHMANIIIAMFTGTAIARQIRPDSRQWVMVADEFDILATSSFVHTIDKLRSKNVTTLMAHQNFEQITDKKLHASLASQPVKVYFRAAISDRTKILHRFGKEEADTIVALPKHHARVIQPPEDELDDEPVMFPFLMAKQNDGYTAGGVTIKTDDWWAPFSQDQLEAVIEQSSVYLQPRHDVMEVYDAQPTDEPETSQTAGAGQSRPRVQPASTTPGGNQQGREDTSRTGPLSLPQQQPGGGSPLPGDDELTQQDIHASRRKGRGRSITPASLRGGMDREGNGLSTEPKSEVEGHRASTSQHPDQEGGEGGQKPAGDESRPSLPDPMDP